MLLQFVSTFLVLKFTLCFFVPLEPLALEHFHGELGFIDFYTFFFLHLLQIVFKCGCDTPRLIATSADLNSDSIQTDFLIRAVEADF